MSEVNNKRFAPEGAPEGRYMRARAEWDARVGEPLVRASFNGSSQTGGPLFDALETRLDTVRSEYEIVYCGEK